MIKTCQKHPKYKGKKKPINSCNECLILYIQFLSTKIRTPIKPTIRFKNKKSYNRIRDKKKHEKYQ